jgi:peptidoglycan biosynthesis protein MviN/MurJ (putative lipid II flippase)
MLWGSLVFIAVVVIGSVLLTWIFRDIFPSVIAVLLNALLLYLLLYRAYFDLRKGRWRWYVGALVIGVLVALWLTPYPPFWPITIAVVVVFLVIEVARALGVFRKRVRR